MDSHHVKHDFSCRQLSCRILARNPHAENIFLFFYEFFVLLVKHDFWVQGKERGIEVCQNVTLIMLWEHKLVFPQLHIL